MLFESKGLRIFLYQEGIDMRSGFEKLHYFVREKMNGNINQGHLYLFFGKNRRRLKTLYYDGTGLVLVSKRMERGRFMGRAEIQDISEITIGELKQIFNGGLIVRPKLDRSFLTDKITTTLPTGSVGRFGNANLEAGKESRNFASPP